VVAVPVLGGKLHATVLQKGVTCGAHIRGGRAVTGDPRDEHRRHTPHSSPAHAVPPEARPPLPLLPALHTPSLHSLSPTGPLLCRAQTPGLSRLQALGPSAHLRTIQALPASHGRTGMRR
jgi:hypothetical protein